jgi:hypothetical protein
MPRLAQDARHNMFNQRESVWLVMEGRLKDGVDRAGERRGAAIGSNLEKEYPNENRGKGLMVVRRWFRARQ